MTQLRSMNSKRKIKLNFCFCFLIIGSDSASQSSASGNTMKRRQQRRKRIRSMSSARSKSRSPPGPSFSVAVASKHRHVGKKKRRQAEASAPVLEDDYDRPETVNFCIKYETSHKLGYYDLDATLLQQPPANILEREASESHVQEILDALLTYQRMPRAQVLIVRPHWKEFDGNAFLRRQGVSAYTIGGNHSRIAVTRAIEMYPRNKRYRAMPALVIGCESLDEVSARFARNYSVIDNNIAQITKKTTIVDKIKKLHRRSEEFRDKNPAYRGNSLKLPRKWLAALKLEESQTSKTTINSVGQWWQVAKLTGSLWEQADRLICGSYFVKQGKKNILKRADSIGSCHYFNQFGGLDDDETARIFELVLSGKIKIQKMPYECKKIKARKRLIREAITIINPDAKSDEEQAAVMSEHPQLFSGSLLDGYVTKVAGMRDKDPLPEGFLRAIRDSCKSESRVSVFGCVIISLTLTFSAATPTANTVGLSVSQEMAGKRLWTCKWKSRTVPRFRLLAVESRATSEIRYGQKN